MTTTVLLRHHNPALVYFDVKARAEQRANSLANLHHGKLVYNEETDVFIVDANKYYADPGKEENVSENGAREAVIKTTINGKTE